jgi:hypothetical protein
MYPPDTLRRHNSVLKYWEIIADNLSKAGWSWGCVSAVDSQGRTIWIADAHRDDGKRFVVRADEKLTAFLELESTILASPENSEIPAKYSEIIADNLSKAGWSWGCVSAVDSQGRTIFVADAHRNDGKRFIVRADDKLTAFLELGIGDPT